MNDQILYNSIDNIISIRLRDHSINVVPSSCILNIYSEEGASLLSDETITPGSDGTCSYFPGSAITDTLAMNNLAVWTIETTSTFNYSTLFDVVLNILRNELLDQDLFDECEALTEYNYIHSGTADSGNTLYLEDNELMNYPDNNFLGGLVEFVAGTNSNNSRIISEYTVSTGKIKWVLPLDSAIDSTTQYIVRKTYQRQIDTAWNETVNYIDDLGFKPGLILNNEKLKTPHKYLTLAKICFSLVKETGDIWMVRSEEYKKNYYTYMAGLKFRKGQEIEDYSNTEENIQIGFRR